MSTMMILPRLLYLNRMAIFRPKDKINRFNELDIGSYKDRFKMILLDIDNTIAVPDTGNCDEEAARFIKKLQDNGFIVVIFSNNTKERVKRFIGDLDVEYYHMALKPLPFSYWIVCRKYGVKPSETLVLGDQLLTDILGANLSGCHGIYTRQLVEKDSRMTARNRKIEKFIWRNILHEEV